MAAKNCATCGKGVYPLEAVVALDKSYHKQCFRCKHCDNVISLKSFSAIEGEPYCKPHYLELFKQKGNYASITNSDGSASSSFNASASFKGFNEVVSSVHEPKNLKKVDTNDKSAPVIDSDVKIKKIDRQGLLDEVASEHHLKPQETVDKSAPVIDPGVHVKKVDRQSLLTSIEKGVPLEKPDATSDRSSPNVVIKSNNSSKCAKCGKAVYPLEMISACDKTFHKQCFRCKHCDGQLSLKGFSAIEGEPYCKPHYLELFKTKGNYAAISGSDEVKSTSFNTTFKGVH